MHSTAMTIAVILIGSATLHGEAFAGDLPAVPAPPPPTPAVVPPSSIGPDGSLGAIVNVQTVEGGLISIDGTGVVRPLSDEAVRLVQQSLLQLLTGGVSTIGANGESVILVPPGQLSPETLRFVQELLAASPELVTSLRQTEQQLIVVTGNPTVLSSLVSAFP